MRMDDEGRYKRALAYATEKHKGQFSCNPIVDWNSAEVFLHMYESKLYISDAYKKGNRRVGCLICPRASERNDYLARTWYKEETDKLLGFIKTQYSQSITNTERLDNFIANGGWKARKNGRDIVASKLNGYEDILEGNKQILKIRHPQTDWKEWIKTVGGLLSNNSPYCIQYRGELYSFEITSTKDGYDVSFDYELLKKNPTFVKLLKNVFKKAACCVLCHECQADCHNGCIIMENGKLHISDYCTHCTMCHKVEKGCLVYKSLEMPKGGLSMVSGSLNCYSHHAPKMDWFTQYFDYKNDFAEKHTLGSQMFSFFKRFLRDANLLDNNGFTNTAEILDSIGLENESTWAIMLANLAYTPQVNWYVMNVSFYAPIEKEPTLDKLVHDGAKESWVGDIWSSLGRLTELPFKDVGIGKSIKFKNKIVAISRSPWEDPDPRVILYSLYKFADKCDGYYDFRLSYLIDDNEVREGISPARIFGLDRDTMQRVLEGLSINYPQLIHAAFNLDLESISLKEHRRKSVNPVALRPSPELCKKDLQSN